MKERLIGEIGNYYGRLSVKTEDGRFYWGIENYSGTYWEEISESLFDELNRHQDALSNPKSELTRENYEQNN